MDDPYIQYQIRVMNYMNLEYQETLGKLESSSHPDNIILIGVENQQNMNNEIEAVTEQCYHHGETIPYAAALVAECVYNLFGFPEDIIIDET